MTSSCAAIPCIGAVDQTAYRRMMDDLCLFLQGQTDQLSPGCGRKWNRLPGNCALNGLPPSATRCTIDRVVEKQKVVSSEKIDSDVIAMAQADGEACVQIFSSAPES